MAQTTMYAGFVNSPEAKLTAGISSSATTIPVDYLEYFPAAPNVATIGKGPNAETIYYGAKSAASGAGNLTTVTRGWNKTGSVGAAIAWPIATVIARRPTEYDHATFKANIEDLAALNLALYKGVIDCSGNPNYPAANAAEMYFVSVSGKIGGASGVVVTAGDTIICNTDSTASGDQATVGTYWNVLQTNIDLTNIAITGGAISGCNVTVGAGKTLDVSAGTLALADNQISGDKVEGGTIAGVTITALQSTNIGIGVVAGTYPLHIKGAAANDLPTYSAEFLDADNWTSTDWTGSWAAGWTHNTGNTTVLSHDHAAVNATKYQIAYTVTGRTAGTFTITFGGQTSDAIFATGAWGPTTTSTGYLQITPTSTFDGTVVISIKSLTAASPPCEHITNSSGGACLSIRATNAFNNTIVGVNCGKYITTGTFNAGYGDGALSNCTTGERNTAIGYSALAACTTGYRNTAIGYSALVALTRGYNNTAVGYTALVALTTGYQNDAVGQGSLAAVTSGYQNSACGTSSLLAVTTGYLNAGVGFTSGRYVTEGYQNTFVGAGSANTSITTGYSNTFIGYTAGYNTNQKADAVNSMGLGANAFTNRSNQVVIGDANVVETQLRTGVYIGSTSTTAHTAPTARLHIAAGSATAGTAPIKLTSGAVNTTAEAGAIEFLTDDFYATITTGAARKCFVLDNGARLTSGKIPIATTNGRLIDGQTPLGGTKVYYVADSSGGAVTRKLTFIDGVLTSET